MEDREQTFALETVIFVHFFLSRCKSLQRPMGFWHSQVFSDTKSVAALLIKDVGVPIRDNKTSPVES